MQEFFLVNLTSVELIMNHSTSSPPRLGKRTYRELSLALLLYEMHAEHITVVYYHFSACSLYQYETEYSEGTL